MKKYKDEKIMKLSKTKAILCGMAILGMAFTLSGCLTKEEPVDLAGETAATPQEMEISHNGERVDETRESIPISEELSKILSGDVEAPREADPEARLEDARQLIETFETCHPAFSLSMVPEGYESAKQVLLETAEDPGCTLEDFIWAAKAYGASLQDGHTKVSGLPDEGTLRADLLADKEHLYLLDENGKLDGTEILAVGGVPALELFAAIDKYLPAENQSARDRNHGIGASSVLMLKRAGAVCSEDGKIELNLKSGGQVWSQEVGIASQEEKEELPIISATTIGDVFYVDFNQCFDGAEFQETEAALREAVMSGTSKVIIDVRGNSGGASSTCVRLLEAMGMKPPKFGYYVRYSALLCELTAGRYEKTEGTQVRRPDVSTAKANPEVELVVLTDEGTFSSAMWMAAFVQDGKLGTVIGRPSANAPDSYGDIVAFKLQNTRLRCTFSSRKFERPAQDADKSEVRPDILTGLGEDALEIALEYLSKY